MRFERLLWECLLPGRYELEEEKIAAALEPAEGESVLLFNTDNDAFRGRKAGEKVCDLMFFYRGPAQEQTTLLFVELKGSDYEQAEKQLVNTVKRVFEHLDPSCQGKEVHVCAVVLLGTATPINMKERIKDLRQQTGLVFKYHFNSRHKRTDIRPYLSQAAPLAAIKTSPADSGA